MSRKTVCNLCIIVIVVTILLSTMIIADFNFALHKQRPVFCITQNTYEDGGTVEYIGLGYKIIDYNVIEGRQDVKLGTLFMRYDSYNYDEVKK